MWNPPGSVSDGEFFGEDYTPHGDTHLRTVQKYSKAAIQAGFNQSTENLLDAVNHLQILQPPVTVAIDITTWPYHAEDDLPPEVSGTKRTDETAYKFATLSLVGKSMPIILAYAPVIESSEWDDNLPHRYHRTVRTLVRRAQEFVTIDLVLADRGFESMKVYQTLNNLGVSYLSPKIERSDELERIDRMEQDDEDIAVERVNVAVETGSHECRILYVPGRDGRRKRSSRTNRSHPRTQKHGSNTTHIGGVSKTSIARSSKNSSQGHPRRITNCDSIISCLEF